MDFPCAAPILDALHRRVDRKIFGYSDAHSDGYLKAVQGWFEKRHDWHFELEDIYVAPGVVPSLAALIRSLTKPGDGIIVQEPVYYPFMYLIENNGRRVVNNALVERDGAYAMNFADLEQKAADSDSTMMILCNPHNPVGRVWTQEELRKVADICIANDVFLISDEIHCDLVREGSSYTPIGKISSDGRIVSCTAASKSFNLAGLQTANIIIKGDELRALWSSEIIGREGLFGSNPLGIVATEAAYTQGASWLDQVNGYVDENLEYVGQFLSEQLPKAKYSIPEGTYFAWIDFRAYGYSAKQLERMIRASAGVVLDDGCIFGDGGECFERINVACPRSILHDCMVRIKGVFQ